MKEAYDTLCGGIEAGMSAEAFLKKVKQKLAAGELTKEQAIALAQQYMDNLEYNEPQMLTDCGGIQPEVIACTERF